MSTPPSPAAVPVTFTDAQLAHRVKLIRGTREFVVCDTETTDKVVSARILSLCLVELLDEGPAG